MEEIDRTIPDHCPNCNVNAAGRWGHKIGTSIVGCRFCLRIYERKDLEKMLKEKSTCGIQSTSL